MSMSFTREKQNLDRKKWATAYFSVEYNIYLNTGKLSRCYTN